jgi:hypothetical protein
MTINLPARGAKRITFPAGTYIVGDPCYNVPDDAWDGLLEDCDFFDKQCHGQFVKADGTLGTVVGFSTKYGDGTYDYGKLEFPVDAGLIGIIPVEDVPEPDLTCSNLVTFTQPFECFEEGGVIVFGHIEINTGDDPEEFVDSDWDDE